MTDNIKDMLNNKIKEEKTRLRGLTLKELNVLLKEAGVPPTTKELKNLAVDFLSLEILTESEIKVYASLISEKI